MRFLKYLIAVWVTISIYTVSSFLWGSTGVFALQQLSAGRVKQQANIEALKELNQELEGTKNALKNDPDTIMIYARELGYGTRNEHFVRIVGMGGAKKQRTTAGQISIPRTPNFVPDRILWFFAICCGLGVLVLMSISEFMRTRRIRWKNYR